jgi:hypothetical protein
LRHKNPAIIKHLAFLSVKYEVYLEELYEALGAARKNRTAICGKLSIEYRGTVKNEEIFLIKKDEKIVVQFHVDEKLLYRKDLRFESWLNNEKVIKQIAKQNATRSLSVLIQDLRNGMKKVNVEAEVLKTEKPQLIHTQFGTSIMLTNVLIGDETGKVKLCLWGQTQIAAVGDIIQIKNASVRTHNGERQLNLGQTGTLTILRNKSANETNHSTQSTTKNKK